jgi:hypothetical protein
VGSNEEAGNAEHDVGLWPIVVYMTVRGRVCQLALILEFEVRNVGQSYDHAQSYGRK